MTDGYFDERCGDTSKNTMFSDGQSIARRNIDLKAHIEKIVLLN